MMHRLIKVGTEPLIQLLDLIHKLPRPAYVTTTPSFQQPIGRHVRHTLDLYRAIEQGDHSGVVDYDVRSRGSALESNPQEAERKIARIMSWLSGLSSSQLHSPVRVKTEVSIHESESVWLESNLARELCYVGSHTIHHLAYMSLLARLQGIEIDAGIGVAPATVSYYRSIDMSKGRLDVGSC